MCVTEYVYYCYNPLKEESVRYFNNVRLLLLLYVKCHD